MDEGVRFRRPIGPDTHQCAAAIGGKIGGNLSGPWRRRLYAVEPTRGARPIIAPSPDRASCVKSRCRWRDPTRTRHRRADTTVDSRTPCKNPLIAGEHLPQVDGERTGTPVFEVAFQ
jgi:hypothetical protein